MTPAELSAIRARLDAATPGNWKRFGVVISTDLDLPQPLVVEACSEDRTQAENDVEFIANAPTDLRALMDEVERLTAEIDVLRGTFCEEECEVDGETMTRDRCGVCLKCAYRRGASGDGYTD